MSTSADVTCDPERLDVGDPYAYEFTDLKLEPAGSVSFTARWLGQGLPGAMACTVTVQDQTGRRLLDFIDPKRYTILPNTAGCFTAEEALRTARLGREILLGLENPGANWVKLEVLADTRTLLPDPVATLEAYGRDLAAFARWPDETERAAALQYLADRPKNRRQAFEDLLWALLNSKEFLFDH